MSSEKMVQSLFSRPTYISREKENHLHASFTMNFIEVLWFGFKKQIIYFGKMFVSHLLSN